jgi:tetratricopeptide (TPR) repeat protein
VRVAAFLLVFLVAAVVFAQTVFFPFVFDDEHLIAGNAFLHEPWSALRAFAHSFWHGTPQQEAYYRPMVVASFALNGRLLGFAPWGFHLVNVLLHAANAALLLGLLLRLAVPMRAALFGALLFAVHPAAAWPVASIVARVDLLPAFFVLLAFHALAAGRPVATGLAFLAALLSKESAAAFVAIPFLALWAPLGPARRRLAANAGAACIAALAVGLAARVAAHVGGMPRSLIDPLVNPMAAMADADRVRAALRLAGRYLLYLVAPLRFSDGQRYGAGAAGPAWGSSGVLLGLVLLGAVSGAALWLWWRRDRMSLFLAFALGALLPASQIFFPISSLYAQNFLYMPSIGLALCAGDLLGRRLRGAASGAAPGGATQPAASRPALGLAAAAAALLAALAAATFFESRVWSSAPALFTTWGERFPRYALGWSRLGVALLQQGDIAGSESASRRSLALFEPNAEAHYNLGVALLLTAPTRAPGGTAASRLEDGVAHSRRAAALEADLIQAHVNAAKGLLLLDRPVEAEQEARAALALDDGFVPARLNLAESLFRQERYADAVIAFRALARLFPKDPNVRSPYVVALLHAGDPEEARRETEAARRDFPDLAWFDFCLARVEARAGHAAEARDLLRRARERDPQTDAWIARVHDFDHLAKD